jgi:hypothetical protein
MEYVGNFEEGNLRSCPKTHGVTSIDLNLNYFSSLYVYCRLNQGYIHSQIMFSLLLITADSESLNLHNKFKVFVTSLFMV